MMYKKMKKVREREIEGREIERVVGGGKTVMRGIERGRVGRAGKGGTYLLEKLFFREICIFVRESRIRIVK